MQVTIKNIQEACTKDNLLFLSTCSLNLIKKILQDHWETKEMDTL